MTLTQRIESIKADMRERGASFTAFMFDDILHTAELKDSYLVVFNTSGEVVYRELAFA